MMIGQLFIVNDGGNTHFICNALGREDAKRKAHRWLGRDKEKYIVTPLTQKDDRVKIDISWA